MGTNYYMVKGEWEDLDEPIASMVVESPTPLRIHIGKSSGGWCFSLHVMPEMGISTYEDWKNLIVDLMLDGWRIEDEYHDEISPEELHKVITDRRGSCPMTEDQLNIYGPDAEIGPNNLARSRSDGSHCIGHGEGTWSYIIGYFS